MGAINNKKMINKIIKIAIEAGEKILEIYNSGNLNIQAKDDGSPLTKADKIADETIINRLKEFFDYPIVTEESYVEYQQRKDWPCFWLVDPLDGTKDFIAGNGEFTINIALIKGNQPVLGLVYAPALKLMYWAERGKGAFRDGKKIYNSSRREELIGADSRFHSSKETVDFFTKNNIKIIRQWGSALKICKLAEGEVDVYPRLNGTCEWDTVAADIVAREAGCKLIDVETKQELAYNKKVWKNNHFIASRNDLNFL